MAGLRVQGWQGNGHKPKKKKKTQRGKETIEAGLRVWGQLGNGHKPKDKRNPPQKKTQR